jgi:hypothetical protein
MLLNLRGNSPLAFRIIFFESLQAYRITEEMALKISYVYALPELCI